MNKKLLFVSILFASSILPACNEKTYKVNYMYNVEGKETYLVTNITSKQRIVAPTEPETEDLIFTKWTLDKEGNEEYLRWGLVIDSDLTLYAQWTPYETLTFSEKADKFLAKLQRSGKDACKVKQDCYAEFAYPALAENIFGVHDKYEYNRYTNVTTKDYSQYDEVESGQPQTYTHYAQEQWRYDSQYYYDIYCEDTTATNDKYTRGAFEKEKANSYVSIDYANMFKSDLNTMVSISKNPSYTEETFQYEFDGNPTKITKDTKNYSYNEKYWIATYSDTLGDWSTQTKTIQYGLVLESGYIVAARVETWYTLYIGEDCYQIVYELSDYDFYYNNSTFTEFKGVIFPYQP